MQPEQKSFSAQELAACDGSDASKPLLLACMGTVFDVSPGADFYGPGGSYAALAGTDASYALAKMDLGAAGGDVASLSEEELKTLREWRDKFLSKYKAVGKL